MKQHLFINRFEDGSVFGTVLMVFFQVKNDLLSALRRVYKVMFVNSAETEWLDIKAEDYSKIRKKACKAEGLLTITRDSTEDPLVIPEGYVFKTLPSIAGSEYRFISTEKTVIPAGELIGYIPITAENEGSQYNVPVGSIKRSLVHIQGVSDYSNNEGWLLKEGSDREDDESFRQRVLNSWAELSTNPIALKYKNVAESVEGVLYAVVDDMHPRGQGTVDIIIASSAGTAGEKLLNEVETACQDIKGVYDNLLIKSAETEAVNISIILRIPNEVSEDGLVDEASEHIREYLKISTNRSLNVLYTSELIFYIRKNMDSLVSVKVTEPSGDLILDKNKVIVLGSINVSIERVKAYV